MIPSSSGRAQDVGARRTKTGVAFLRDEETDALLSAPDRSRWTGRRDHALLLTMIQTGLRVSDLTGLDCVDITLTTGPHLHCHGKGRKERVTPLTPQTAAVLRVWQHNAPAIPTIRCSRPAAAVASAVTRSLGCWPSTSRPQPPAVRPSAPRRFRRTHSGTRARCACCTPALTPP
jgi:integrase/recombinase XerD